MSPSSSTDCNLADMLSNGCFHKATLFWVFLNRSCAVLVPHLIRGNDLLLTVYGFVLPPSTPMTSALPASALNQVLSAAHCAHAQMSPRCSKIPMAPDRVRSSSSLEVLAKVRSASRAHVTRHRSVGRGGPHWLRSTFLQHSMCSFFAEQLRPELPNVGSPVLLHLVTALTCVFHQYCVHIQGPPIRSQFGATHSQPRRLFIK